MNRVKKKASLEMSESPCKKCTFKYECEVGDLSCNELEDWIEEQRSVKSEKENR